MPYTVQWFIPDEVLYAHYSGVTTPDELRESMAEMQAMIESSPRNLVHTISDVGDIDESVPLVEAMKIIRETGSHPRSGWAISIRERSPLVKMGSALGASIFRLRFRAFASASGRLW